MISIAQNIEVLPTFHLSVMVKLANLILIIYLLGPKDWSKDAISGWFAKACCPRCFKVVKGNLELSLLLSFILLILEVNIYSSIGWFGTERLQRDRVLERGG